MIQQPQGLGMQETEATKTLNLRLISADETEQVESSKKAMIAKMWLVWSCKILKDKQMHHYEEPGGSITVEYREETGYSIQTGGTKCAL